MLTGLERIPAIDVKIQSDHSNRYCRIIFPYADTPLFIDAHADGILSVAPYGLNNYRSYYRVDEEQLVEVINRVEVLGYEQNV